MLSINSERKDAKFSLNLNLLRRTKVISKEKWTGAGCTGPDTEVPDQTRKHLISAGSGKKVFEIVMTGTARRTRTVNKRYIFARRSWLRNNDQPKTINIGATDDSKKMTEAILTTVEHVDEGCESDEH